MSHNKITVDNQSASATNDIPVNLSSYITESSPVNNEIIAFNGKAG